jgi:PKD repeat protein
MKNLLLRLMMLFLAASLVHSCGEPLNTDQIDDYPALKSAGKTSYIVVLDDEGINSELSGIRGYAMKQQAMQTVASRILNRAGIADGEIGFVYTTAVQGFSVRIPPGQVSKLQNDPAVIRVEEDQIATIIGSQPDVKTREIQATGTQPVPWGIARVNGGIKYDGTGVAWIIDSGIDLDHPDLNVDESRSVTFIDRSTPDDQNGHGTHVAGTVAAIDNSIGVVGVAAGATVISVRVLDRRGSGSYSGVIAGINHVAGNGKAGDVANMSLGGGFSQTLNDAVIAAAAKGIKFSLAAGNESTSATTKSPASAEGTNIYTVSAMASGDLWASYSNYGNPPVDYCAPGSSIYSTYKDGGYATLSGTSMAAPHIAGLLLLADTISIDRVKNDPDKKPDLILVYNGDGSTSENKAPIASFTFTTEGLTASFTDASHDSDGDVVEWSWNFGDGTTSTEKNPVKNYSVDGTYNVSLTVTDNGSLTGTTSKPVQVSQSTGDGIMLTAAGYKVKGAQKTDLTWSGASGTSVEIYRNGVSVATVANNGKYTDNINIVGGGTYIYKVCETGGSVCSNVVTVTF